jgi:hypothetical protein
MKSVTFFPLGAAPYTAKHGLQTHCLLYRLNYQLCISGTTIITVIAYLASGCTFLENGSRCRSRGGVVLYDPLYSDSDLDLPRSKPREGSNHIDPIGQHVVQEGALQPIFDTAQQGTSNSPSFACPFINYHHDLYKRPAPFAWDGKSWEKTGVIDQHPTPPTLSSRGMVVTIGHIMRLARICRARSLMRRHAIL